MIHTESLIEVSAYQDQGGNYGYIVIPAGKQHDGEKMVQWYHLIYEDFHWGNPNGEHRLVDEFELNEILNNNYINQI